MPSSERRTEEAGTCGLTGRGRGKLVTAIVACGEGTMYADSPRTQQSNALPHLPDIDIWN
jgi:hypothetical protein